MFSLASTETPDVDFQFRNRLKKQFDKAVFQRKLVRWIVETNQSFRVSESDTFRDLLDYLNPIISATNAHISHDAIRRRVADEYHFFCLHIVRALRRSPSAVHIAFDGWTSRNQHPLFGVVAFFLDQSFQPPDGLLTEDDWKTIGYYHSILRQFEACVKDLEGDWKQRIRKGGKEAAYGLMQDICPAYEWLIGHLEDTKLDADRTPEPAHFRTNIKLAWVKLNKYYSTIDQSPAYNAATVLHPAIRWVFLRRAYRERPEWIEKAQQLLSDIWQEYKKLPVQFERDPFDDVRPVKRAKEAEEAVDTFSSYLDSFKSKAMKISPGSTGDELDRWLHLADPV
ncbi:hypothetical protein ACQRIU_007020 [Beauveria bassiana]